MRNARVDEAQDGIKISRRNIITSDTQMTPPLQQSEEELKSLLKVKEESEKVDLKHNIQKAKIMASGSITSWKIVKSFLHDKETVETVRDFFGGL